MLNETLLSLALLVQRNRQSTSTHGTLPLMLICRHRCHSECPCCRCCCLDVPTLLAKWQSMSGAKTIYQSHKTAKSSLSSVVQVCQDQVLLLFLPRVTTLSCRFVGSTDFLFGAVAYCHYGSSKRNEKRRQRQKQEE